MAKPDKRNRWRITMRCDACGTVDVISRQRQVARPYRHDDEAFNPCRGTFRFSSSRLPVVR